MGRLGVGTIVTLLVGVLSAALWMSSPAPPITSPEKERAQRAPPVGAVLAVDARGDGLQAAGIARYRFRSTLIIPASRPYVATYLGSVDLERGLTRLTARGLSGDFELYLVEEATWFRYPGGSWQRLVGQPWRFSPAGPIPHYTAAGTIAKLAARRDLEVKSETTLLGFPVVYAVRRLGDVTIEIWVTGEGLVLKERITQRVPTGLVELTWEISEVNGPF